MRREELSILAKLSRSDLEISDITTRTSNLEASAGNAVGVRWDASLSSPVLARLGAAVGKNAGTDFNNIYPYSVMKLCNVSDDGTIRAFYGDPGFTRDGSNGEVMVVIPKFYYKHTYDSGTKKHEFWVSGIPLAGYRMHPCFTRAGVEKPYILVGAYKAGIDGNSKITSRTASIPKANATRANFRTYGQNRGTKWLITDALARSALGLLILIEYANADLQTVVGKGITELRYNAADTITEASTSANTITVSKTVGAYFAVGQLVDVGTSLGGRQICQDRTITAIDTSPAEKTIITVNGSTFSTAIGNIIYSCAQKTGSCDSLNGISGMAAGTNGKTSISYRGLEDIWGNGWEFIDGINIKNSEKQPYIADNTFSDNTFTGTYKASGITLPASNGYIKNIGYSIMADWLLIPSEIGGSSSTYIPDYFYQNWGDSSEKIALAGGNWNGGSAAGFFAWNANYSSGNAHLYIGARALLIP